MKKVTLLFIFFLTVVGYSQVTNSTISGTVKAVSGATVSGATVAVVHQPTGSKYFATTEVDGSFSIPSVRPGGPYVVKVTFMGYKPAQIDEVNASLGNNTSLRIVLQDEQNTLKEVVVVAKTKGGVISKSRTGASQQFSTRELNAIPIIGSRNINAITKYNANAGSGGTFGGQDSRLNNFTIDGSVFNNGFGLGGDTQAGGRTGSTAISLDAIEQLQINIAPYDVRQSGFVGSGINAVTRSGTNTIEGSVYTTFRNNSKTFLGTHAGNVDLLPSNFDEKIWGARVGAPIIKDKLFIFANFEKTDNTRPGTTWTSFGSPNQGSQVANTNYNDLVAVSDALRKFGYETGPFENYDSKRGSKKFLVRLDWNINDNNKASLRYVFHDSFSEEPISNSNSVGVGNRASNINSMSFQNSGYTIQDNTRSTVFELNSKLSEKWSNNFIAGFDKQIEDRALIGSSFPLIDIKNGAVNYISAGLDPFTPGNKLDYSTLHFSDNVTKLAGKHTLLFGFNFERFVSNNLFTPAANGAYVFDNLKSFTDATNEAFTTGLPSVNNLPNAFAFRYSALPGRAEPLQVLKSNKIDLYVQDEYKVAENLKFTFGLRASRTSFENTALENPTVTALTFANGEKLNTGLMANPQILFEPMLGFNLDLKNDGTTQIRGGSGVFTGRPPFVFLSNAIGNNGVLTGYIDRNNSGTGTTVPFGFTPSPTQYFTPVTATLPATVDLAFTDRNFKFPQVWKTNIAVDQKLPFGFIGTIEGIYSKNINAISYYNANLDAPVGSFTGVDNRPFYAGTTNGVNINNNVANAIILTNTDKGAFYSTTFKIEYPYKKGLSGSIAYTHSNATDLMSAGSVASGSWTGARSTSSNNNLALSNSNNNTPNRIVGVLGYRFEYGKNYGAATSISLGYIGEQASPLSYTYAGDMNGDRVNGNDLLFVPNKATDLKFADITQIVGGSTLVLYTAAEQQIAFDKFIDQDSYLSTRRGQYVERNAQTLPILHKLDLSITQDFFVKIGGKKNSFQFRADILNFTNLLNRNWGVSQRSNATGVLVARPGSTTAVGSSVAIPGTLTPVYQLGLQTEPDGTRHLLTDTYQKNASTFDVWTAQITLRYTFGK
jgi:Carboxypeptidase regulatory-like domain